MSVTTVLAILGLVIGFAGLGVGLVILLQEGPDR